MKTLLVFLLVVSGHSAAAVTHSLKVLDTTSSGVPNFPEFVAVVLVDEVQIGHYDSNTKKAVPNQESREWVSRIAADEPMFSDRYTKFFLDQQQFTKADIDTLKQGFNQTGGIHIYQRMYGCEWNNETKEVKGLLQFGYDGEDFIGFDLKNATWIALTHRAVITKHKWDSDIALRESVKNLLARECPERLKKFVQYGRNTVLRTELPSVSVLQKTPSSPISCHATGFYPDRASLFWRKDGEELHEDVDLGEILPNHDRTFQMSVELKLSIPPEDHKRYDCVFQLSGVKEDMVTMMDDIRTNQVKPAEKSTHTITIFITVTVAILAAVIGVIVCRKKKCFRRRH